MPTPLIQPTFSGGELSPSLQARVDIERYGNSVKTGKNFIVRPYGGLVNRPGFQFITEVKTSAKRTRLLPFVYSTEIAYVVELGDGYARFLANGAYIESAPGVPFELATPWAESDLFEVKHTQSADVLYLVHPDYPPQTISRTTATTFVLAEFKPKEGPFRDVNANEAFKISVSATNGPVTVTANADIFTASMVGLLLYVEVKALGQVRPWQQGDRSVTVGAIRRSDGKTYRCTQIPTGVVGKDWSECGSIRPIHQFGREWDGPGDNRDDGTYQWTVGVEWEYLDSGYGIVEITGFTDAKTVTGNVVRALPAGVVGGLGAAANTWTFSGNGVTKVFSITGATSPSTADYEVTIGGELVQPDPNYVPPPTSGGGFSGGRGNVDFEEP